MRFAIAGGGTGGHLFPALAVAEVMRERGHEALIFISEKEIDALATRDRAEFRFEKLPSVGMPRLLSPAVIGFLFRLNSSIVTCKAIYKNFRPDAVLGMGGFTSTPPIFAGRRRGVPTFLHESNAIPGKANRLNARMADVVFLGFEACKKHFPNARCEVTGTPLRRALAKRIPRDEALATLGLQTDRKTLLIMGGSQGAQGLNRSIIGALPELKKMGVQIIHLTGSADEQVMDVNYKREGIPSHVAAFSRQMETLYSAADLAIARSGAASLTELSWFGLPSLLVPYPHAAENHQALNAEIFEQAGAAKVIEQAAATGENLTRILHEMLDDESRLKAMSESAKSLGMGDAAVRVVKTIEHYCT
jgi:UDP-N-acetylglucosamine--N-acetylmuramyl-(pentapeptide) pyrophosphoryl-undecaprenol N-acetylglucosamine transferase